MVSSALILEEMIGSKNVWPDKEERLHTPLFSSAGKELCTYYESNVCSEKLAVIAKQAPLSYVVTDLSDWDVSNFSWIGEIYICHKEKEEENLRLAYPFLHSLCRLSNNKSEAAKKIAVYDATLQEVIENLEPFQSGSQVGEFIEKNRNFVAKWLDEENKGEIIGVINELIRDTIDFALNTYEFNQWSVLASNCNTIAKQMFDYILVRIKPRSNLHAENILNIKEPSEFPIVSQAKFKGEKDLSDFAFIAELMSKDLTDELVKSNWDKMDGFIVWINDWQKKFDSTYQSLDSFAVIDSVGSREKLCDIIEDIVDEYLEEGEIETIKKSGVIKKGSTEAIVKAVVQVRKSSLDSMAGLKCLINKYQEADWSMLNSFINVFNSIIGENNKLSSISNSRDKWRFVLTNKEIKRSLEFAQRNKEKDEKEDIDKRTKQIRDLIPEKVFSNEEDVKIAEIEIEKLIENFTKILKRAKIERIPWPANGRCSDQLLMEGYEKYNSKNKTTKIANEHNKIYAELQPGIKIDGEIKQSPKFDVFIYERE